MKNTGFRLVVVMLTWCCVSSSQGRMSTWTHIGPPGACISEIAIAANGTVFALSDSGLYRSTNRGEVWRRLLGPSRSTGGVSIGQSSILVGMDTVVLRSTDNGETWATVFTTSLPSFLDPRVTSVAVTAATGDLFVGEGSTYSIGGKCGQIGGMLHRSTNDGATWQAAIVDLYPQPVRQLAERLLFARGIHDGYPSRAPGCWRDTVWRSTDGGASWVTIWSGVISLSDFATGPDGEILAGVSDSVMRSTNRGDSWQLVSRMPSRVTDLTFNATRHLFVATEDSGIYMNFLPFNNGLANLRTTCLAVSPDGYLYAGTDGGGLFRTMNPTTAVGEEILPIPATLALTGNYPNPFNPGTTIVYQLPTAYRISLRIFDLLGREVAVLVEGMMEAGSHEVEWDASGMQSGVYFCRLEAAGSVKGVQKLLLVK